MKRFKQILFIASALLGGSLFTACSDDNDTPVFPEKEEVTYDMSGFARGADVSWLTEMESSGRGIGEWKRVRRRIFSVSQPPVR